MRGGPDFIFFLQDKLRRFWQLDSSGNVVLLGNPYPLDFSPDGWSDIGIRNVRNRKYWGIDRSVSTPFKFVEDGAKILKHIYYVLGVEEPVFLTICEREVVYDPGVDYGFWYKQIYRSQIDLTTFSHEGPVVLVNMLEEGLAKHLKANENTAYEIELTDFVKMDGVILKNTFQAVVDPGFSSEADFYFENHLLGLDVTNNESAGMGSGRSTSRTKINNSNSAIRGTGEYFLKATVATTINFRYNLRFTLEYTPSSPAINPAAVYKIVVRAINESNISGTGKQVELFTRTAAEGMNGTFDISGTLSMVVDPGEELYLYAFCSIEGATGDEQIRTNYVVTADTLFEASYDYRYPTTFVKFARPQAIFATLIDRITGGEYQAENCPYLSDLYNSDKVLTSGDALRGVPDAKLRISLNDFFAFFDTFDAVGLREKAGKVLMDRKAALVDAADVIDLGTINRPKVKYDKSFAFNELAVGYPDVKNESGVLNGKNEVNTTFTFSQGTTASPRKYDKTTRVKVSCYDIENVRIEGTAKNTTDNRADNDIYALHIGGVLILASGDNPEHYLLNRAYNTSVTGVDQASSVFNLIFSPKNCVLRSGDYLRSCFYKSDGRTFRFISADRNSSMVYADGVTTVAESADFQIGDLAAPFFVPVQLVVEAQAPADLLDRLDANPLAVIQFTFEGQTYRGLIDEVGINPKTGKQQTYTLLSFPDNDLTKFIDYYG